MKQSAKTALGGIIAALSVVIMMMTVVPFFIYALPAFAGVLIMLAVIEIDKKWAFGIYVAVCLVSIFIVPDKEAAVMYIAFFGYYPIVKALMESKLPRVAEYLLKFALFNVSVVAAYAVLMKFMGLSLDEMLGISNPSFTKIGLVIMLVLANVMFIMYDFCLTKIVTLYLLRWQKRFRQLFKH